MAWPLDYEPAPPGQSECSVWELEQRPDLDAVLQLSAWDPPLRDLDHWTATALSFVRSERARLLSKRAASS